MQIARWIRAGSLATVLAVGGLAPAAVWTAGASEGSATVAGPDWSSRVWEAAGKGDFDALLKLLEAAPENDAKLTQNVAQLKAHLASRETKRTEQIAKVSAELDKILAGERDDISLSLALKSAVELHYLAKENDKAAVLTQPRVTELVKASELAAKAAENRGDWLAASDLYSRLGMLFEEQGQYRDDVKREMQRLAMIRLYSPEGFWKIRNTRRNAEIAWKATHKDILAEAEDERVGRSAADIKARKDAETKPLPPYNPMGDDYQGKLAGIDENMVQAALNKAWNRNVEKKDMGEILRSGLDSVRTLVTTRDLETVFNGLRKEQAKAEFLAFLDVENGKLENLGKNTGMADMMTLVGRLAEKNEKTVNLPKYALMHEFGNGGMLALDEFSAIIWPDEIRRFNRNTQGRFVGVGIQIELDPLWNIRVVTPLDGTPAQKAGVRPGDLIRKVDGQSTEGFTIDQAVDVITGMPGTPVTLTLERTALNEKGEATAETSEVECTLTRTEIKEATVKGWKRTGPG